MQPDFLRTTGQRLKALKLPNVTRDVSLMINKLFWTTVLYFPFPGSMGQSFTCLQTTPDLKQLRTHKRQLNTAMETGTGPRT